MEQKDSQQKDPIKYALWGLLVGNIEDMGILPALQGGKAIADSLNLEGKDVLEKLQTLDGKGNYEIHDGNDEYSFVITKSCPFSAIYSEIPEWSEQSMNLVASYNRKSDGGGALHPLCLVHKGVRNSLKAGIVSIGCRSKAGKVEIAEEALEEVGMTEAEALELLEGKACLFALPK
jgi:hypothetical protein